MRKIIILCVVIIVITFTVIIIYKIYKKQLNDFPLLSRLITIKHSSSNSSIEDPKLQYYHSLLIGTAYTHYQINSCSLNDTGILVNYAKPGVRQQVQKQLIMMRQSGIDSSRIIIWHMHDIGNNNWGIIPSPKGVITEPYQTNLINFFTDLKTTGYRRLTVGFSPQGVNSPLNSNYDSTLFDENWGLLSSVRNIAKQYGPSDIHIDLLNEGGPPDYWKKRYPIIFQAWSLYITNIYRKYISEYGNKDETISYTVPHNSDQMLRYIKYGKKYQKTAFC